MCGLSVLLLTLGRVSTIVNGWIDRNEKCGRMGEAKISIYLLSSFTLSFSLYLYLNQEKQISETKQNPSISIALALSLSTSMSKIIYQGQE